MIVVALSPFYLALLPFSPLQGFFYEEPFVPVPLLRLVVAVVVDIVALWLDYPMFMIALV